MYKPTIWQDHVEGVQEGTDVNAKNLNNIEIGVMEAAALAALNAENIRHAADVANSAAATANANKAELTSLIENGMSQLGMIVNMLTRIFVITVNLKTSEKSKEVQLPEVIEAEGTAYCVTPVIRGIDGGSAGDIIVSNRTDKSFIIQYTGTANAVTIDCVIRQGEIWSD